MFSKDELQFIDTVLSDELFRNSIKRSYIEDFQKLREFDRQVKDREDFIRLIISKIRS